MAAVHRTMDDLSPAARQHIARKAECHGKEFPFIYRYYEVTDIPDRHTEGGDAVVSCLISVTALVPTNLIPMFSVAKAHFYHQ